MSDQFSCATHEAGHLPRRCVDLTRDGSSGTVRLLVIHKLAVEAAENRLLDRSLAQAIVSLKGVRQAGARAGNWLTREQARDLLARPDVKTLEGKRDRAILAVLLGCGLRRSELAALDCRHIRQRDGRWVLVDLVGKGNGSAPWPCRRL